MRTKDTTDQNLANALKTLMAQKPFEKITIGEICDLAKLNRRNFYRHFKDKYALLQWIFRVECFDSIDFDNPTNLEDKLPALCYYLYKNRKLYASGFNYTGQNSLVEYITKILTPYFEKEYPFDFFCEEQKEILYRHIVQFGIDLFMSWFQGKPDMTPDEFCAHILDQLHFVKAKLK